VSESEQSGAGRREVAYRLFATEYDDADLSYSESDEDRAPNYVITPTGARINRLFVVGVLTEVEAVSDDVLRARVVDPTGAFVLYAGQYQPDEQAFLDGAETPAFVAVTGKARTFQPEDSDRVFTSVRPESINEVTADTRDRWTVQTAEQTLSRVGHVATALSLDRRGDALRDALVSEGVDEGVAAGTALALDHYETSPAYLEAVREMALDAAQLVAGEVDAVEPVSVAPDAPGDADLDVLEKGVEVADASVPGDSPVGDGSATTAPEPAESPDVVDEEPDTEAEEGDSADDIGEFEPGEFDLDEAEREEIEAEYGTEFQTGTEVDEPGEAGIETPEPDETGEAAGADTEDDAESGGAGGSETAETGETDETEATAAEEPNEEGATGEDVDLEDAAVEVMEELDEGGGADREAVVAAVVDRYGASPEEVEDAVQDALMDGRCYEPDDDTLKPI
jgi:RPA family protein